MSKVIAINGAPLPPPGEPDEDIVALLERHLADAKAGKTSAVAIVSVDRDGWVLPGAEFRSHRFSLLGGLSQLQFQINMEVSEEE